MEMLSVLKGMIKREFIMLRRYAFNTLSGLITLYLFFILIFYGAQAVGGEQIRYGSTLEGIIVGYMVWTLTVITFSELAWTLTREAQYGTLEQLYMSPVGFGWVAACQVLTSLLVMAVWTGTLLGLMMVTTGRYLNVDVVSVIPIALLLIAGVAGIGFGMGGLQLVFRRVEGAFQIMQFVFLGLIVAPTSGLSFVRYLPVSLGSSMLRQVMVNGMSLCDIPAGQLAFLAANSAFYLGLGFAAFKWCERICLDRGLLGHY